MGVIINVGASHALLMFYHSLVERYEVMIRTHHVLGVKRILVVDATRKRILRIANDALGCCCWRSRS
jgi:hypothetical protein